MENNTQTQKRYSFFTLLRCVDRNNQPYVGTILSGRFFKVDPQLSMTSSGKEVIHCRMSIQNRDTMLTEMFGLCPPPDDSGTVWAQVSFFGKTASRFASFAAKYPDAQIVIQGSMEIKPSQSQKNGKTYTNINIAAFDFDAPNLNRKPMPAQAPAYGSYVAPAPATLPAWGQSVGTQPPQAATPQPWGQPNGTQAPQAPVAQSWGQQNNVQTLPVAPATTPPVWNQQNTPEEQSNNGFVSIDDDDGELPF